MRPSPLVHLELHTGDLPSASAHYAQLLGWRPRHVGAYLALDLARGFGGGIVECGTARPVWIPYAEVRDVDAVTDAARGLGASVLLEPRDGPAGRRSVVAVPEGGEIALWQREVTLLDAARRGDEAAFEQLVAPHRAELHAHCYRMLASVQDAEDALQEALLGAWRGLGRFEGRSSLRSWLYKVATNACLRLVERRPKLVLPVDYGPAADPHDGLSEAVLEPLWVEPYPDAGLAYEQRESVELAFIAALQHLPARQRAVLILSEVLGFSGAEVAEALETTPASVYSALQRAHKTVDERLPRQSQQATLRALGDERLRLLVGEFIAAWERSDVGAVAALLTDDVTLAMPPLPEWYAGIDAVSTFLGITPLHAPGRWRVLPVTANGQAAVAGYLRDEQGGFSAHGIELFTLEGGRIAGIMAFLDASMFARFGLPDRVV